MSISIHPIIHTGHQPHGDTGALGQAAGTAGKEKYFSFAQTKK